MGGIHRRKRRQTTTTEYAAMLRRMARAYGPRIGEDMDTGLAEIGAIKTELEAAENYGAFIANRYGGRSLNQIAAVLRISKQAAAKRVQLGQAVAAERERAGKAVMPAAPVAVPRQLPHGASQADSTQAQSSPDA